MNFQQLGLSESLLRAVSEAGYRQATPIQLQAIPVVLEGRDLMGCAQTGTGKTAAFALPTLQRLSSSRKTSIHSRSKRQGARPIRTLILVPTRELADQVAKNFSTYGRFTELRTTMICGGVSQHPQVHALRKGVDILVATPGRLLDLVGQGHVDLKRIEILILDEADQMLDMGFLPDLKRIVAATPDERQTLMFSATMPQEIRRLATRWLEDPAHVEVTPVSSPVEAVEQSICYVHTQHKPQLLTRYLQTTPSARTLVFVRTKHGADKIVKKLVHSGIHAAAIHGNKTQNARSRVLKQFKSTNPPVLVATDIAARGLDVDGISHVINYELPEVPEVYVHRIGRTGRAGASGIAISFCSGDERSRLKQIERLTRRSISVAAEYSDESISSQPARSSAKAEGKPRRNKRKPTYGKRRQQGSSRSAQKKSLQEKSSQGRGLRRNRRRKAAIKTSL